MIQRALFLVLIVALGLPVRTPVHAQEYGALPDSIPDRYDVSAVDRLATLQGASAIIRLHAERLVVESTEEATVYGRKVVTVFEEEGRSHAEWIRPYDSFLGIEDLEGRVLDEEGTTIKELEDENVRDRSAIRSFSLYSDARVRVATLSADTHPYTVEYRYELELMSPFWWPTWRPQHPDVPTEFAQYEVEHPSALSIRHAVRHDTVQAAVSETGDQRILRWQLANRLSYDREPFGPSWQEQAPAIHVAPTTFDVADTWGDMRSWNAFGEWYHQLKQGRDELPSEAARQMHQLVRDASSRRDSVRRIYRHLQESTRYVGVQLGVGGWQPFSPAYVRERGYGDCKALTNYMEAALDEVGISSHPTLIYRGRDPDPIWTEFPSNQFNHAILMVPLKRDTLWLENTDTTAPFGHVAADIEDRYGLVITPDGGTLRRTPSSRASDNRRVRTASVQLDASGNGDAAVQTVYTGNKQDYVRRRLSRRSDHERRKWLRNRIDIPSFDLKDVDFSAIDAYRDTVELPIRLDLPRYASATGSRLFVPLQLMRGGAEIPPATETERTQPVHATSYPYVDVDSIRFELPPGYAVEAVPAPDTIETEFAVYRASVRRAEDALVYRRQLEWRDETLPPDQYDAFREFRRKVAQANEVQAVLVKRDT